MRNHESPETLIMPYEDANTRQSRMTGEKFPDVILGICDNCHWCYSSLNSQKGAIAACPVCDTEISQVPMAIDEVCTLEKNDKGIVLRFSRRFLLR